jgi:hypothetical protein
MPQADAKSPSSLSMEDTSSHGHIEKLKAALFWKFGISTSSLAMQVLLFASGYFPEPFLPAPRRTSRMFTGHECGYIDRHLIQKYSSMFSPNPPSSANAQANESVNRSWSQAPTLTPSKFEQIRLEEQLFSPASHVSAQLHQDRIEKLSFSSTSPLSAEFERNRLEAHFFPQSLLASARLLPDQVAERPFSPPSPVNEVIPPGRRSFQIPQPLPRPFDALYTEHSYLLDCLQIEKCKATELLRSIAPLEERPMQNDEPSSKRKRVKKRLRWLRHRVDEITRQEKRILRRVRQVTLEIQMRERCTQIESERRQCEVELYSGFHSMQQIPLHAESPVFQPQGYQMPYTPWPTENWPQWQSHDDQEGCEGNYRLAAAGKYFLHSSEHATKCFPSDKRSPDDITTTAGPSPDQRGSRRCSLMHRSSSLNDAVEQLEVFSTNTTAASGSQVKRLSLPSLAILLTSGMNISELTPEEKDVGIHNIFKNRDQEPGS